jgi:precorrin-3B synthase
LLPSVAHDRVRNIVTSPVAGLEGDELVDTRPLVRELDERLRADVAFAGLHPKFSFGLFGGGRRFSLEGDDLCLEAVAADCMTLSVGGVASGFGVAVGDAVECLLVAARVCLAIAVETGSAVRGKRVVAVPGALERVLAALPCGLNPVPGETEEPRLADALQGVCAIGRDGRVSVVPSVPLGRMSAEQAGCVAAVASEYGGDLRLAPWRGVLIGALRADTTEDVVRRLNAAGLSCDARDGFGGIAACAGSAGCEASLADVRGDAAELARVLAGHAMPAGWTVNFSGCEKQCGRRHGATADLIAEETGYTLKRVEHGVVTGCSADFAIGAVAELHDEMMAEVACR